MAIQVEIGLEIAEMARQDDDEDGEPMKVFQDLIRQCLRREQIWKAFYAERMESVRHSGPNKRVLEIYATELRAEQRFFGGDYGGGGPVAFGTLMLLVRATGVGRLLQEIAAPILVPDVQNTRNCSFLRTTVIHCFYVRLPE